MRYFFTVLLTVTTLFASDITSHGAESDSKEVYNYLLNLSMEELANVPIQSSGLFAMSAEQAPGFNYVVTKDQLDTFGIRSLADYLNRMAPSFATVIHGTQGTTVGSRGVQIDNSSKTLLLRDNINMNNRHFVGINGSELSSPLLGDLDRLEVSTGPGVLQHGSGAINGFLNMVSSTGASKPGVRMHTSYGSGDSKVVEASFGQVIGKKANFFVYGGYDKSNGLKPHYTLPTDKWSGLNGVNGTPSETYLDNVRVGKTDDDYKFSFRSQYGKSYDLFRLDFKALLSHTSNVDPVLGEYLGPNASWAEEVRLAAEARGRRYSPFYEQQADNFMISPEITLQTTSHNEIKLIPFYQTIKTTSVFSDFLKDEVERLGINLQPKNDCLALGCRDNYSYGDEVHWGSTLIHTYRGLKNQTIAWGAEAKHFDFGNNIWDWTTVGLFAEDQLVFGDITLLPGIRYDTTYFGDTIATVPPFDNGPYSAPDNVDALTKRFAISYKLTPQQTVKLSYQEGFRFTDSWPQRWTSHINATNSTNVQIDPEESESYEANYSILGLMENRLDIAMALFYNQHDNTQGWIEDLYTFGNSPKTITSVGGDISLEFHPTESWQGGISYSYAKPISSYETSIRIANDDSTWTRYPNHMIKFRLGHEIIKNLFVGTMGAIESPRYEKAAVTDPQVKELFDKWSFVMDANAWYQVDKHWKISFIAKEIIHKNFNQYPAYFSGARALDAPRPDDPQYYLELNYAF
ncbi:MAG: TonB-dependent receptor plug domain-containing protein [Desulfobulbaceae bacterium]|nr:TonB-dependent receptor plug domain-containing protein [Desulfobulbaceae bacterium]